MVLPLAQKPRDHRVELRRPAGINNVAHEHIAGAIHLMMSPTAVPARAGEENGPIAPFTDWPFHHGSI
jgi:ABC-type nitrate/sulfonate/bicarbonate transport system substrate-binding protein